MPVTRSWGDALLVLRLFRFRPLEVAFDRVMREVILPELVALLGVLEVCAGRRGPEETGPRLVVSLWSSIEAMSEAMGEDLDRQRFFPELLSQTADHELEILPVALAMGQRGELHTGILRVARGGLEAAALTEFIDAVHVGIEADRRAGYGPAWIALAMPSDREFVTVSCWSDWSRIERATGSTIDRPIHTKGIEGFRDFTVEHFELLPIGQ